eukprot:UN29994
MTVWSNKKSHYEFHETIGQGSYGIVYKATHTPNGKPVAIKQMGLSYLKRHNLVSHVQNEIENHSKLHHENIVELYTSMKTEKEIFLVLELCEERLIPSKGSRMSIEKCRNILKQIVNGIQYLHSFNLIHRDIKPCNIMLTKDGIVKLLDLGLS